MENPVYFKLTGQSRLQNKGYTGDDERMDCL
jgi:hypothetical protein